jgi:hypothetical protein
VGDANFSVARFGAIAPIYLYNGRRLDDHCDQLMPRSPEAHRRIRSGDENGTTESAEAPQSLAEADLISARPPALHLFRRFDRLDHHPVIWGQIEEEGAKPRRCGMHWGRFRTETRNYSHLRMEAKRRALDEIAARQGVADEKRKEQAERRERAAMVSESAVPHEA